MTENFLLTLPTRDSLLDVKVYGVPVRALIDAGVHISVRNAMDPPTQSSDTCPVACSSCIWRHASHRWHVHLSHQYRQPQHHCCPLCFGQMPSRCYPWPRFLVGVCCTNAACIALLFESPTFQWVVGTPSSAARPWCGARNQASRLTSPLELDSHLDRQTPRKHGSVKAPPCKGWTNPVNCFFEFP